MDIWRSRGIALTAWDNLKLAMSLKESKKERKKENARDSIYATMIAARIPQTVIYIENNHSMPSNNVARPRA